MQIREINYQGKKLVYRTAGEGLLIVLLHGFGEDGLIWKEQFGLFPNNQLIVPDLPGSGMSEAVDDMSMEGLANDVKAIINAERHLQTQPPSGSPGGGESNAQHSPVQEANNNAVLPQSETPVASSTGGEPVPPRRDREGAVILIGHSMGGYISLAYAEKYPGDILGFGLFHSTAFADSEEKKETRQKGIRFIQEHGAAQFLKTTTPNLYSPKSREEHPEWIEEHLAATRNFSGDSLVSYYEAMIQRPDRNAVLSTSNVPVLFVMGRHDTAVPIKDGLAQCHLPQIAYIHILEHSGHMGMIEETAETARCLSQFVNDIQKTA